VDAQVDPADDADDGPAPEAAAAAEAAETAPAQAAPQATQSVPRPTRVAAPAPPTTFVLRDIVFANSSRLLNEDALARAEAQLVGKRYRRSQAAAIAQALNVLYTARGYSLSQVVLQGFNPGRGTLTVAFYEPRVGDVRGGTPVMSNAYLRHRMNLPRDVPADAAGVSERVERLGVTDGLTLTYTPVDTGTGEVDILVNVPEIPRHQTTISLDNYGSPAYGEPQLSISHRINGLFGWNDPLVLGGILRPGLRSLSLDYSAAVAPSGARLSLSLLGSESASLETPSVLGSVRSATAGVNFPIIARNDLQFSLSASVSAFAEMAELSGVPTLDQVGGEVTLGASAFTRGESWTFSGSVQLAAGTYDDAVASTTGNTYAAVSGNATFTTLLGEDAFGSVSLQGQKNITGTQPSQRTFTTTAPYAVRGYPTGLAVGDSGYAVRAQVEKTTPFTLGDGFSLRPFAFADIGEAFDATDTGLGLASSIGLGVSFGNEDGSLFGDLYVAKPITTAITGWTTPSTRPVIAGAVSLQF